MPAERREGIFEDYIIAYLGRIVKREFHQRICAIFNGIYKGKVKIKN